MYALWLGDGEGDDVGDVFGLQRVDAGIDSSGSLGVAVEADFAEGGLYDTRLDGGDFDIAIDHIDADAVAESFHGCFGGAVHGGAGVGVEAGGGAQVHDVAAIFFQHGRQEGAGHQEEAFDIGIDHLHDVCFHGFAVRLEAPGETGVVDQDRRGAEFFQGFRNYGADGSAISHIKRAHGDRDAVFGFDFLLNFGQLFLISGGQDQVVFLSGQRFGSSKADAAGGTGDKGIVTHRILLIFL